MPPDPGEVYIGNDQQTYVKDTRWRRYRFEPSKKEEAVGEYLTRRLAGTHSIDEAIDELVKDGLLLPRHY